MKTSTRQILKILYVLSWIIFVGICVEAGGFITNAVAGLVRPSIVPRLWQQADLSDLFKYDHVHFFALALMIGIVAVVKGWLFYRIIEILHNRKLDLAQPFSRDVKRFIFRLAYMALLIGLFSMWGAAYAEWLTSKGVHLPDVQQLRLAGADVWLFMSVILFVIAQIFKRGIEIQTENELTI